MAHFLSKTLLALSLSLVAGSLIAAPAPAPEVKKTAKAKPAAKPKAKAKKAKPAAAQVAHEDEPDVTGNLVADYNCELGNKVTVYTNEKDEEHIAVRWKKRLHRLTRVGTTTGAKRFENKNFGLIWIGIPAKGMLLDSRLNRQLANECKTQEQEMATKSATAEPVAKKL
jgi:hypothetical protein